MGVPVKLLAESSYIARKENPKIGSHWEKVGQLITIYNDITGIESKINAIEDIKEALEGVKTYNDYNIKVKWEEGIFNTYRIKDLFLEDLKINLEDTLNNIYKNTNTFKSIW